MTPEQRQAHHIEGLERTIASLQDELATKIGCPLLKQAYERIKEMEARHAEDIGIIRESLK